jgi:hypothetical protein
MICSQKRKFYANRLQQLCRLGLTMPPEYGSVGKQTPEIAVEQSWPDIESTIISLPEGRTVYMVWLSLSALRPGVHLYDYRLEPPWPDHNFEPLPKFADNHIGEYYRVPGGGDYPRDAVLNLNFRKAGWRLPGTRIEGLLCAISTTPIPDHFKHGARIPVGVSFFDRTGRQVAQTTVILWADQLTHQPQRALTTAEERTAESPVTTNAVAGLSTAWTPLGSVFDEIAVNDVSAAGWPRETGSSPAAAVREGVAGPPDPHAMEGMMEERR